MAQLRLGVDARPLSWPAFRGVQRVAQSLLNQIIRDYGTDVDVHLYSNQPLLYVPRNSNATILPGSQLRFVARELPRAVKNDGCDVFLGTGPAVVIRSCPSVYVVHDGLMWGRHPVVSNHLPFRYKLSAIYVGATISVWAKLVSAISANSVICNSESVKRDLQSALKGMIADPIVIHWGVADELGVGNDGSSVECVRYRFGIRGKFLLYVGAVNRLKNIDGLVKMYQHIVKADKSISLVVVGPKSWPGYMRDPLKGIDGIYYFSGISDGELSTLYETCRALVTLSWYEGFGLPVVEAMSHGVPLVVSNRGALPEVAGGAGLVVDPCDPEAAAQMVIDLLSDPVRMEKMRAKSYERVQYFSWRKAAREVIAVLQSASGK